MQDTQRKRVWLVVAAVLLAVGTYSGFRGLSGHGFGSSGKGCELVPGGVKPNGVTPVRAECVWSVPLSAVLTHLDNVEGQDEIFSTLAAVEDLGADGGQHRYLQLQDAPGMKVRAVVVDWTVERTDDQVVYRWSKASDQSAIAGRGVEVSHFEGFWEVSERDGKSHVTYVTEYSPGGSVPKFLIRWFQGTGIRKVLDELRKASEAQAG